MIAEIYGVETDHLRHFFVQDNRLTAAADVLINVLLHVDDHALEPKDFAAETLSALGERLDKMHAHMADSKRFELNEYELESLTRALNKGIVVNGETITPDALHQMSADEQLNAAVTALCDGDTSPVPRLAALCAKEIEYRREINLLSDTLEYTTV